MHRESWGGSIIAVAVALVCVALGAPAGAGAQASTPIAEPAVSALIQSATPEPGTAVLDLGFDRAQTATPCPDGCDWITPTATPSAPPTSTAGPTTPPPGGTQTPTAEPTDPGPTCASNEVWDEDAHQCYGLQSVGGKPTTCLPSGVWGSDHEVATSTGDLSCLLPLQYFNEDTGAYQDAGLRISGAVGCLNVEHGFGDRAVTQPRALTGLVEHPFRLSVTGVLTPSVLGLTFSDAGWYRQSSDSTWTVTGRTLGEMVHGQGQSTFDLRGYLGYRYPDIRQLNVYLRFNAQPDQTEWGFAGGTPPREAVYMANQGPAALHWFMFFVSSYPSANAPWIRAGIGPSKTGDYLPAYMVTARSAWTAELVYSWEVWTIEGGEYKKRADFSGSTHDLFGAGSTVASYRVLDYPVWDAARMAPGANTNCDAATGFIPVPVVEAQSVLLP